LANKRNKRKKLKSWKYRRIAEAALGRPLKSSESVHHINGDHNINTNRNLLICSVKYHRELHKKLLANKKEN
jgi:hypothetical protein